MSLLAGLGTLVRVELVRLLRTREVHLFLLLPALLGVPLITASMLAATSFMNRSVVVALPADLPEELWVHDSLEEEGARVEVVADPGRAYADGEVDAAVLGWLSGEGVEGPIGPAWQVRLVAVGHRRPARQALREGVRRANRRVAEERALAAGVGEGADIFHVWWSTVPAEAGPSGTGRFQVALAAYVAFLLGLISYQVVPIAVVSDRLEGIAESFGATPVPPVALVLSRLVAVTLLELLALALLLFSAWGLLSQLVDLTLPGAEVLGRAGAALLLLNSLYLLPGVRAGSAREALNLSSVVLLFTSALLGAGLLGAPSWVPLAGLTSALPGAEGLVAIASTLVLAGVAVALAVRLTTPASLVPPGGTR